MKNTLLVLIACWFCTIPTTVLAQQLSQLLIDGAMKECHAGRIAQDRPPESPISQKARPWGSKQWPRTHFALFCNLGELMRIDGELSITSVRGFRRMTKELDRTLELAPDHLDALSAKGTFLVRLPSMLGGDREKGEKLLRYVLLKEPQSVNARLSLAKRYCATGRHIEALSLASEALDLAQAQRQDDFLLEAENVLAQLRTNASKAN